MANVTAVAHRFGVVLVTAVAVGVAGVTPSVARADAPSVVVVLDASGSMNDASSAGVTRLDAAKQAIRQVMPALPAGAQVGLRVYGSNVASNSPKQAGCRDSTLVVPVGPLDAARFSAAVDRVRARGWTPIGYALRQAAKDLPATGSRTVILVSDGLDTCGTPRPCDVARDLGAAGVRTRVETVGFALPAGDPARSDLQCIAKATGAGYRDATDVASLARALKETSTVALRGFDAAGAAIVGSSDPVRAPALAGTGDQRKDTIRPGDTRYYAVQVGAGQQVEARATVGNPQPETVPDKACDAALRLALLTPRLSQPRYATDSRWVVFDGRTSVTGVARTGDPAAQRWPGPYLSVAPAGTWWFQVQLVQGNCGSSGPLPRRAFPLQLSATVSGGAQATVPSSTALAGGSASTNAVALPTDTRPVTDTIAPGETRWWSVPVTSGSQAFVQAVLGGVPWTGNACRAGVRMDLLNSTANIVASDFGSFDGQEPAGGQVVSSWQHPIGSSAGPTTLADVGTWYVRVALTQQATCSSGSPIPVVRYPLRLLAEVRPYAAPAATVRPTATSSRPSGGTAGGRAASRGGSLLPWLLVPFVVVLVGVLTVAWRRGRRRAVGPDGYDDPWAYDDQYGYDEPYGYDDQGTDHDQGVDDQDPDDQDPDDQDAGDDPDIADPDGGRYHGR